MLLTEKCDVSLLFFMNYTADYAVGKSLMT